jgi:hypothetical protein
MSVAIKLYLSMILLAVAAFAQPYALHLAGTGQTASTGTIPGYSLGDFTVTFRIHKSSGIAYATDRWPVFKAGPIACGIGTSNSTDVVGYCYNAVTNFQYGYGVDIRGRTDVIVRARRVVAESAFYTDTWDGAGNFLGTIKACVNGGSVCSGETTYTYDGTPAVIGSTSSTFDIDFIRWDSGSAYIAAPPANTPTVHPAYGEWTFENTLADASVNGLTLTMSTTVSSCAGGTLVSGACFLASPVYNPIASIGGTQYGVAANQTITLTSSSYSSTNPNGIPSSFAYSVTAKPTGGDGTLGTPMAANTTMVLNNAFGTYYVQLVATDSFGTGTSTTKIGAVPESANHVVSSFVNPTTGLVDPDIAFIMGPVTRWGAIPDAVPFEGLIKTYADTLDFSGPADNPLSGTVDVAITGDAQSANITCHAGQTCHFLTEYAVNAVMWVRWHAPGDATGVNSGRAAYVISSITDDNTLYATSQSYQYQIYNAFPAGVGYVHSRINSTSEIDQWRSGQTNKNYYDCADAIYKIYFSSGIDDYLTLARQVADRHVQIAIDNGMVIVFPRIAALRGAAIRALDGKPGYWQALKKYLTYDNNANKFVTSDGTINGTPTPVPPGTNLGDLREIGYTNQFQVITAKGMRNADGTPDTATRSLMCAHVKDFVENLWKSAQTTAGEWMLNSSLGGGWGYTYVGPGYNPFHYSFPNTALMSAHQLLTGGYCDAYISGAAAIASDALATLAKSADALWDRAIDKTTYGAYYAVDFIAAPHMAGVGAEDGLASVVNGTSTITAITRTDSNAINNQGGTTVPHFLKHWLPDRSTYVMVCNSNNFGNVAGVAYPVQVDHADSDTSLTLVSPWVSPSQTNVIYSKGISCTNTPVEGTLTMHSGSTVVDGTGTLLTHHFLGNGVYTGGSLTSGCASVTDDCSTYINLGDNRIFQVGKVNSDAGLGAMNLVRPWPYADQVISSPQKSGDCISTCNSSATSCTNGVDNNGIMQVSGDPQLNLEMMAGMAYRALQANDVSKLHPELFTHAFPPGIQPYYGNGNKPLGQMGGAGANQQFLAYRAILNSGPCSTLSFSPSSASAVIGGATGTFNATVTDSSCDRSVTSSAGWLTCTANCSGTGSVTGIGWAAAANAGSARSATLTGGGVSFTVTQSGTVTCTYSLAPTSHNYPATGAAQSVTLTASDSSCAWTATYPDAWLTGSASGTGTQTFNVTAAANAGSSRSSTATIAGQSYAATQDAAGVTGGPSTLISGGYLMTGGVTMQ